MRVSFTIRPALWLGLAMVLFNSVGALAAEELLESAHECAVLDSRLERLGCYDALFQAAEDVSAGGDPRSALWHAINAQEAARDGDDMGLLVRERSDGVLMSVPALGSVPPRPQLVIACEKSITRFQLHLPTAVNAPRARLRLVAAGREQQQEWRVRDGGYVVSGGRGLPAIATLRQLLDADELVLGSDLGVLDGLRFELSELRRHIQPLRDACRW
ncbi:type VI secretion system-associated protein VasI [Halomonas heilongjiangensis]|uniref:Type VI secretion system-associated protein TagO n=1 Tax=Halomonas heilongjiangensis TaxID=1387883 RepID=A0A2N7TNC6_9GAMM|nr:type VI secretion system-associated protein VasI [Halomonas heilongjiangensis]PMR69675.1 type VI secretion system-associated protein TagO [Halomonas heilongjiangensis]PXX93115.1 type VI secretion system-associated protein TagO [Halomonas heilongjiangensis]